MKLTSAVIATLATTTNVVEGARRSSRRQLSTYGYGEGLALEDIAGYTPGTTVSFCLFDLVLFVCFVACLSLDGFANKQLLFIIIIHHHSSFIINHAS